MEDRGNEFSFFQYIHTRIDTRVDISTSISYGVIILRAFDFHKTLFNSF